MLEGLVAWVLNNYLGKYVENLNTDQLSVALLSGKVELENLPLKKDALRHLGLPIEIKAGFIGKVQLQVPVRQIRSAPWLISIQKLYLVAAPVNLDEWDANAEAVFAHERKVAVLDALEAQWRASHEVSDGGYYATSYSSWLTYGTGLLANIVENLQLTLTDVHLRYEDASTCAPAAFAAGLTVESLVADSCDSEWRRGFTLLQDPDGCSFKLLELNKLALYWDPMQVPAGMLADCQIAELTERMSETWKAEHHYILPAAGAQARVRRERTELPLRSRTRPRLAAHLTLDSVLLTLTSRQYGEAVGCTTGLERVARLREFRALRPAAPVARHARDWWIYALSCHLPHHPWTEPRPTWESCGESARATRKYVEICLATLCNPAATLPPDLKAAKDEFEWRTPLPVLKALRELAMRKVPASTPPSTPERPPSSGRSMLVHWFPQWWGWYGAPPAEPSAPPLEPAPPAPPPPAAGDLEEEILDVIADSLDNNTLLKRDTVFGKFEFLLSRGSLVLRMEQGGGEVELQFSALSACVESRPRAASHLLSVALGSLALHDRVTPHTLFPIICAPQGVIREGLSATAAPATWCRTHVSTSTPTPDDPLFQLTYEKKPFGLNCDYRLWVKSGSIEIVYNAGVATWARQFLCSPWGARTALHAARDTTRARLRSHWQHMLRAGRRRTAQIELDVSAPQILVAEALASRDAAVLLVDFGRLRLGNAAAPDPPLEAPESPPPPPLDEDTFMTPCSTPPGSLLSPDSPRGAPPGGLDAAGLRARLYDRYEVELGSLQILVGRVRDNWQYAHTKPTSSLHLLDRFSISATAERRVVHTQDPHYPTATLCGSLPSLSVHVSEQKLLAVRAVLANLPPFYNEQEAGGQEAADSAEEECSSTSDTERSERSEGGAGGGGGGGGLSLVAVQFGVEQLALEVQSRGRSIAEVQVCGVRAALQWRPRDLELALSVHSLLLVDALQTYGPDFELLVASHKHVGMDTASGSIRGSEPTSPISPGSPTSLAAPAHPHALTEALQSLHRATRPQPAATDRRSPLPTWMSTEHEGGAAGGWGGWGGWGAAGGLDSEALIAVELCVVRGDADSEDVHIANILFNNLDIIANQETIVELIGFAQRVSGPGSGGAGGGASPARVATPPPAAQAPREVCTEITFDFHRLGVLLLRAALEDGNLVARKIATATVTEAKIQATVSESVVEVSGGLGGVQVVSLCERGGLHTRVVCAGAARPHPAPPAPLSAHAPLHLERALRFTLERRGAELAVSAQVARVWYTHSPALLAGLHSCLAEFKQYLANLARSIRAAAADMALGLVHPRESLYANPKLASSTEGSGWRRRTTSSSVEEPGAEDIVLSVSVELQSPVVVVPRGPRSAHVLLAHLGTMSFTNKPGPPSRTSYRVRIRDISLVSLDVAEKLKRFRLSAETMPQVYEAARGKPVLHNTALQFTVTCSHEEPHLGCQAAVEGSVVGALQVSARREQYEQLLDTLRFVSSAPEPESDASEVDGAVAAPLEPDVPTLKLDPAVRAAVLAVPPPARHPAASDTTLPPKLTVKFEVGIFSVELRADLGEGERSLVELSFREFSLGYRRIDRHESTLQVSLHSITMEDLTKPPESAHRMLMVSHTPQVPAKAVFLSKSCPDFTSAPPHADPALFQQASHNSNSLPNYLNVASERRGEKNRRQDSKCGPTPPCSPECGLPAGGGGLLAGGEAGEGDDDDPPADDNLVWVWVHTRDPQHPHFVDTFNKVSKLTKVEFNRLNLVVSVDSWVAVLDFFGVAGDDEPGERPDERAERGAGGGAAPPEPHAGVTQTEMSIRSLSVVVVGSRGEACRAHVSRVAVAAEADAARRTRRLAGRLGALVLAAPAPAPAWRTALRTHSRRALAFTYHRLPPAEATAAGYDTALTVDLAPLTYVHTKRLVHELRMFAREFSLLRRVIAQARLKVTVGGAGADPTRPSRMLLQLDCATPSIVLPVSGRSRRALVVRLHRLRLDNTFRYAGDPGTVSTLHDPDAGGAELLDVRTVRLEALALHGAEGGAGGDGQRGLELGPPLLTAPTHLTLQLEYNMSDTHNVADMTVQGTLTTLEASLDAEQYRLVRGVLAHNLGEELDEGAVWAAAAPGPPQAAWTTSSLKLELQDVRVHLVPERGAPPLACINFIKSRLVLDSYSDLAQDVDLVSQEILVSDTRFEGEPANRRGNVFTHVVQPMAEHRHSVQAELHARRRPDSSAYTVLVNNMRLTAVLEWWERAHAFLAQEPLPAAPDAAAPPPAALAPPAAPAPRVELKLNVTDSQLVVVEEPAVWDTNAVILRSTTVLTYRPHDADKPVSCSLTELEVFSCVLGLEEETALAILEPAALHVTVDGERVLHAALSTLDLRLSYHDMRMFASMVRSLPVQARAALSGREPADLEADAPANSVHMRTGSGGGGGGVAPRWAVAPRWLRNAPAADPPPPTPPSTNTVFPLKAVKVSAECITLCVIDDCLDSDVPLLEVQLTRPELEQDLRRAEEAFEDPVLVVTPGAGRGGGGRAGAGAGGGHLAAHLSVDYYNRKLSGWEPFLEPWPFRAQWEYTLSGALALGRLQLHLDSPATLDVNLTSSLVDLAQVVRANWAADYYSGGGPGGPDSSPKGSPAGHRRRAPFVPYALRNLTGHRVWFTTLVVSAEQVAWGGHAGPDDSWVCVRAGDTEPFSFGARWGRALARRDALHQLALRVEPWLPPEPVCVDRVGVFFRDLVHAKSGAEARLVFEVSLEGSARKLVTVRSALQLQNKLPHPVEVRVDNTSESVCGARAWRAACGAGVVARARRAAARLPPPPPHRAHTIFTDIGQWRGGGSVCWTVGAGERWAAPLTERAGAVWARPLAGGVPPPLPAPLEWATARTLLHAECRAPPNHVYRFCCAVVREPFPVERGPPLPGHTLTLVPALRLENLLPLELQHRVEPTTRGPTARPLTAATPPGDTTPFHTVDVEEGLELSVKLEGFGWSTPLSVGGPSHPPAAGASFTARLKLRDTRARRLFLNARVSAKKTDGIKVSISAAYWLVNRTGLPLVFRAEGSASEAAGQFEEHEVARMVAPLLFSFAEADGGPTLSARLGRGLPGSPDWCSPFGLGPGVAVKTLEVRADADGGGDRVYAVGVSVRAGRARYRHTNIVTFTPRYQLHNNTSHHLQFAQKCCANTLADPGCAATHVSAVAGCYLPWHWARWDREHLVCVRVLGEGGAPRTAWSAGFRVDAVRALAVPCREPAGRYLVVRVEVAAQGAALLVVFTDAEGAPPPIAIHNHSPVAIMFHQAGGAEESVVGAASRAHYALPAPEGSAALALRAPGGSRPTLVNLADLGSTFSLLYQNFIYVTFTATMTREEPAAEGESPPPGDDAALVLEVPLGSTRVVLARKKYGDRCQLWRRGPNEQLVHEGSSVPQGTDALLNEDAPLSPHTMVLDIEDAAPRPGRAAPLVLRRADPRRASTQAWRVKNGRMQCAHSNLCVQPEGQTLLALVAGARVVLALAGRGGDRPPPEQAVAWHSLRPGSGRLAVTLTADGPTRLLTIRDTRASSPPAVAASAERRAGREWGLRVSLGGLGVSLVGRVELAYAVFSGVALELSVAPARVGVSLAVQALQWDNQLADTPSPVLLHAVEGGGAAPALHAAADLQRAPSRYNAYFFKHLVVAVRPLAVRLEERLLLLVWAWAGAGDADAREQPDEVEFETRRMLDELTALHATRYYFALIKIMPSQIRLSMCTANKLESSLATLKRRLGLTFIKFEDAAVELEPFVRAHVFDTASILARQLLAHFKDELKWQAAKILGSVDFLGNPLGFVADVSEGVSGLLLEGNVGALLKNVTHGLSNSAAKVSESLGDGLERVVGDEAHEETRRRIRAQAAGGAHLAAGLRHLGLGLLGGVTSLVKHSYEGAAHEGLGGFLAGVGKGLVGTVTKPVIGVLDLAAETASAVRDSARRADRAAPARLRPPRAPPLRLLPRYDAEHARGAELLRRLAGGGGGGGGGGGERFLAWRTVRDTPHDIRALLSDACVRIVTCRHAAPHVVMETALGNLVSCTAVEAEGAHFVELAVRGAGGAGGAEGGPALRRPRVQTDSADLAHWVCRHAAYAKQLHHERLHTLHHTDDI